MELLKNKIFCGNESNDMLQNDNERKIYNGKSSCNNYNDKRRCDEGRIVS